ncbi:EF-hand calcium-binding domain-containing protein 14-like [Denticeps clupeoides]|uniref:EF-hand calcium-binding domain-containing protein 14-like n=1 Tax=Denticeps clupeoides TaxID=299321 RepID=UPI0010A58563|nr:EF-hand calcium-binding domain-containing protein 14-like [Denticeps clupeoides]XP_028833300.1 EF-hand calcium-binding domain-containing protein 14-like [Denticeps clupeoides]
MKKRKELNALIGLGDSKRKKTKKGSGHRLLRTEPPDSESESSSDDDEFGRLGGVAVLGKRGYAQCCGVCYPLCVFVVLAACVVACAGLIWMQIALKEDLDNLKEKLHIMETGQQASSHEIPKLSEDLKSKQRRLEDVESGERGLGRLWANVTEINRKISLLDSAVSQLKANIKSAADLINLPSTVEELQKSVATIGSTLTSVQHDVKTIQTLVEEQQKDSVGQKKVKDAEEFTSKMNSPEDKGANDSSCAALKQDMTHLQDTLSEVNASQALHQSWAGVQIYKLRSSLSNLTVRVSSLEQRSPHMEPNQAAQQTPDKDSASEDQSQNPEVAQDTAGKPPQSSSSNPTRRPRFLLQRHSKRHASETQAPVSFPGINSAQDLEGLFQGAGLSRSSPGMSYEDLRQLFGPDVQKLERFDRNRDLRFSLAELGEALAF